MNFDHLPDNTPVLVGIGSAMDKGEDAISSPNAADLMIEAAQNAGRDSGAARILAECERICVPKGTWTYTDPARLIANGIGASSAQTVLANIGVLQQTLITQSCERIQEGQEQVILVCGGEAKFRALRASIQGIDVTDHEQNGLEPDEFMTITDDIISPTEMQRGMAMPVTPYAIMESAMRYEAGLGIAEHRQQLGQLYAEFAAVARSNPDAWVQQDFSAEDICMESDRNRMLAFPYTKRMNTQWNVNQAAALLFCSLAKARELELDSSNWVFPLAATESDHMTLVSERAELARCHGAAIAGQRALELIESDISDIDFIDFYSCFPAAVKAYARELDVPQSQALTITGSMAFAGGPLNNFVIQSTASMGRILRQNQAKKGMISCVSGMLTKQAFGLWSCTPTERGFRADDVSAATARAVNSRKLNPDYQGSARVAGYTVNRIPGFPDSLVAVCDVPGDGRAIATSDDPTLIKQACVSEFCGRNIQLVGPHYIQLSE